MEVFEVITVAGQRGTNGHQDGILSESLLFQPSAICKDKNGDLFVSELAGNVVRKISGNLITTVAGTYKASSSLLFSPNGLTVDLEGNIIVAEFNGNRIRKIHRNGRVTNVQAKTILHNPTSVAVESSGAILVVDSGNCCVKRIWNGECKIVAGNAPRGYREGKESETLMRAPYGITVARNGDAIVADSNGLVLRLSPDGIVTRIAGNPDVLGKEDGFDATFRGCVSVVEAPSGDIYVSEIGNRKIRRISTTGQVTSLFCQQQGKEYGFITPVGLAVNSEG